MGVTKNTTAKITSSHNLFYDKLINNLGLNKAIMYADANESAIKKYRELVNSKGIDCDFCDADNYVYSLTDSEIIKKEVEAAKKVGIDAEFTTDTELPFQVEGAIKFKNQANFNPLKFIKAISEDLIIYENTTAIEINRNTVVTDKGKITAKYIVVATHYPIMNAPGYYFLRMHQERSYLIALKNAAQIKGMYIDEANGGYTFRGYKDYLIFGGPGHRTGENEAGGYYEKIRREAQKYYPNSIEEYYWSAQDCISIDEIPYIGRYSSDTENIFVETGYKKWGMTSSMAAATIVSDMIMGNANKNEEVFSPQRFNLKSSLKNIKEEIRVIPKELFKGNLKSSDIDISHIQVGHGGIAEFEGKKYGVYKTNDKVYFVDAKCPHLSCELKWNPDELSWDCPCHGSRFDYKGSLIDNPSVYNLPCKEEPNESL